MGKLEYTHRPLQSCIQMADKIRELGGSAKIATVADSMGLKVTGSFSRSIAAATKHGVVENKKGVLSTTKLYNDYFNAYNPQEGMELLRLAFLNIPIYAKIYERFKGRAIPADMLSKILIREFVVDTEDAPMVSNLFFKGAEFSQLINNGTLIDRGIETPNNDTFDEETADAEKGEKMTTQGSTQKNTTIFHTGNSDYDIHIFVNGIDSKLKLQDEDDFIILEATINKLKKKMLQKQNENS